MKKITLLTIFIVIFILSCSSTKSSTKNNNGALIGIDPGIIGVVNDWKNPKYLGGKTTKIIAEGYANIDGRGEADARDRALDDAQRKSVEQAVGSIIQGNITVGNYKSINSQIYEKTTGYISSYKVLESKKIENMYYARIEAEVGVDMIQDNLQAMGILIDRVGLPMIVVLVTDKDGAPSESFNVELEKLMSAKGFKFVDNRMLQKVLEKEKIKYSDILNSSSSDLIDKIGVGTGAQVAIVGKANASFFTTIQGTAMKSYRSDIAVRAVNTADATTIGQSTHQTGGVGGSDKDAAAIALTKSAQAVSDDLTDQITRKWQDITQSGTEYTLLVVGLDFAGSVEFEKVMPQHISGLKSVFNRGITGDASKYAVRYIGSSRNLAVDLNEKAAAMGYQIKIQSFDEKTITMNVAKR